MTSSIAQVFGAVVLAAVCLAGCANRSDPALDPTAQATPDLTRALIDAAATALAQGDAATAVAYYRGVVGRDPHNIKAAIGLMQSLRLAGGLDEARAVAAKTLAASPNDPAVLAEVGKVKLAAGDADAAVALLQKAVAADPQDWRSRSALGLAYDRLGDFDRADASYKAALAVAPDNAAVLNNFALVAGDGERFSAGAPTGAARRRRRKRRSARAPEPRPHLCA